MAEGIALGNQDTTALPKAATLAIHHGAFAYRCVDSVYQFITVYRRPCFRENGLNLSVETHGFSFQLLRSLSAKVFFTSLERLRFGE